MFASGLAILIGASRIPAGFGYDAVGPDAFPKLIGTGFLVSAVLIILEARRGLAAEDEPTAAWPVITISGALLLAALLIDTLGWIPMSATVFVAGAVAMGERRYLTGALMGLAFGLVTFAAFNWGLGLNLPAGIFAPVLGQ